MLANSMSTGGYKIINNDRIHFISFAVVEWVDVFTRKEYKDILLDSIRYCQKEKGLILYAWCIKSNHVHMMIAAANNDLFPGYGNQNKLFTRPCWCSPPTNCCCGFLPTTEAQE